MKCSALCTIVWNTTSRRYQHGPVDLVRQILQLLSNHRRGPGRVDCNRFDLNTLALIGDNHCGKNSNRDCASRALIAERFHGQCFVVLHIKDGVELRDLQKVVNLLGQVQQFEFAALFLGGGIGTNKFAYTRAVDIVHVAQVQQDSFLPLGEQVVYGVTQRYAAFTESDSALKVDDRDVIRLTGAELDAHWGGPSLSNRDYLKDKSTRTHDRVHRSLRD